MAALRNWQIGVIDDRYLQRLRHGAASIACCVDSRKHNCGVMGG